MVPVIIVFLLFFLFAGLIIAYCKSPTANVFFKALWTFLVILAAGFVGLCWSPTPVPAQVSSSP